MNPPQTIQSFYCEFCNYETPLKTNYVRHMKTKKHHKNVYADSKTYQVITPTYMESNNNHVCNFCEKSYKYKQGLYRHMKKCKKKMLLKEALKEDSETENKKLLDKLDKIEYDIQDLHKKIEIIMKSIQNPMTK